MYSKLQNAGFRKKRSLFGGKSMYIFHQTHDPNNFPYYSSSSLIFNPPFFQSRFQIHWNSTIQWNFCNPSFLTSCDLRQKFMVRKYFCYLKWDPSIPTSCAIRHISLVPWCAGLERFHCTTKLFRQERPPLSQGLFFIADEMVFWEGDYCFPQYFS